MHYWFRRITVFLSFFVLCPVFLYGNSDTSNVKTNLPLTYFQQHVLEGSSVLKIEGTDIGTNSISFTNPYQPTSTMTTWAGYFKGTIDGNAAKFYCIDISHYIAFYTTSQPHTYTDNGSTPTAITYILNNYYPHKTLPYSGSLSASQEAAAVQIAVWHFSDGVDANTVNNSTIKTRALQIIADANTNSGNFELLTSFSILPATQTVNVSASGTIYVQALDALGNGVANLNVALSATSGTLSTTSTTTGSNGVTPAVTIAKGAASSATITATTSYTIPQGTKYEHSASPNSYQKVVLATPTTANRQAQAVVNWQQVNTCNLSGFTTFTQGGWGSPSNSTPGGIRDAHFADVFPNGLTIGCTKLLSSHLPLQSMHFCQPVEQPGL